jgi:hypothetical protein
MKNDAIEKFVETGKRKNRNVHVHFKTRSTINGIFIVSNDYEEMKGKNFWRIVPESRFEEWKNTKNPSLSRLFNGAEFTRLTDD